MTADTYRDQVKLLLDIDKVLATSELDALQ